MMQQQQQPQRLPVDHFLDQPSKGEDYFSISACVFGGLLVGLTLHSIPLMRWAALLVTACVSLGLLMFSLIPLLRERGEFIDRQGGGVGRIYPGKNGKPKLITEAVVLQAIAPPFAFLVVVAIGAFLGGL